MTGKPTYEELEKRVKRLEDESGRKLAGEAPRKGHDESEQEREELIAELSKVISRIRDF